MPKHPISEKQYYKKLEASNPYVVPIDPYIDSLHKIRVKCRNCGKILPNSYSPGYLLRGLTKCRECYPKKVASDELSALSEQLTKMNSPYQYYNGFHGMDKACRFMCKTCASTFIETPNNILNGATCPNCKEEVLVSSYRRPKQSLVTFLSTLSSLNPKVRYVSGYTGLSRKCLFECKQCGHRWLATPYSLTRKNAKTGEYQGCNECAKRLKSQNNRMKEDVFFERLHQFHPDWDCDYSSFVNFHTPMQFWCHRCGEVLDNKLPINVFKPNGVKCGCDRVRAKKNKINNIER